MSGIENKLKMAYAAANTFPLKFFLHPELIRSMNIEKKIQPIHLQLNPTNLCSFNCPFCSCSERIKHLSLRIERIKNLLEQASNFGCKAATITGGGEPLLYNHYNEMIDLLADQGIQIGLVTNGVYLDRSSDKAWDKMIWGRISASDILPQQLEHIGSNMKDWLLLIDDVSGHDVDWAFSYVLGEKPNYELIKSLIEFANEHEFTHVRILNDIFQAEQLTNQMLSVEYYLKAQDVDCNKVNFQDRSIFTHGMNPCYISLLKPVIGADGGVYPCCGTQYALEKPSRDYEPRMKMGEIESFSSLYEQQKFFNGSICVKCYYENYNLVSKVMFEGIPHGEFL